MYTWSQRRRIAGASVISLLVWALILAGLYGGWKLLAYQMAIDSVERAVDSAFDTAHHRSSDEEIQARIVKHTRVSGLDVTPQDISVSRESREGERIFHVTVHTALPVDHLLGTRVVSTDVEVTHVMSVDEAAIAREDEGLRRKQEEWERQQALAADRWRDVEAAMAECEERWGKGNCTVTEGDGPGRIVKLY